MTRTISGNGNTRRAAELARAEQMYLEVTTGPGGGRAGAQAAAKAAFSRRVVFAAAGVTLLGGCGVVSASNTASTARTGVPRPSAAASGGGSSPGATGAGTDPTPTDISSSPARTLTPPPPDVGNTSPVNGYQVQTRPQYYVEAGPKVIALTLDDGPSQYTPQILEILAQYKVIATFCMIGRQVASNASIVKEVAAAGHHITNHTWDHADQSKLGLSAVTSEITRTSAVLANVGIKPTMYRAPYGAWSHTVFEAAAAAGLRPLDWSVDPKDWSMPGAKSIVANILKHTRTGSIILDHDGGGNRSQTVAAMRIWLPQLLADGYRFTTP